MSALVKRQGFLRNAIFREVTLSLYVALVRQIAEDKKEMIKNVIRQLNAKIEQKQQAVAAAAQTDVTHMARMKEVNLSACSNWINFLTFLVADSNFQNSGEGKTGRAAR